MGRLKKDDIEGHKRIEEIIKKCKELGITYDCYRQRIKNGWTEEEALLAPHITKAIYMYKGVSAMQYLKERGGNYRTFTYHIKTRPIEEAIRLTLEHKGNKKYFRDGMTLAKWCKFNGKDYAYEWKKLKRQLDKEKKSDIIAS